MLRGVLFFSLVLAVCASAQSANSSAQNHERRLRAANTFHDGVFLLHAAVEDLSANGFHQDPLFFYFTGLENVSNAILAVDGATKESWLFLPTPRAAVDSVGLPRDVAPGTSAASQLGIEHVVDWSELYSFLARRAQSSLRLYFASSASAEVALAPNFASPKGPKAPPWLQNIQLRFQSIELVDAQSQAYAMLDVQSADEIAALRSAAKATTAALLAGIRAIRPGRTQRQVEAAVDSACWNAGAHGSSFWPWVFAGQNAVFPRPYLSMQRYDHLNKTMNAGELVRLDVGCEWDHYQGDLGRTIPVSGHFTDEQREVWNIFVAAYHAAAAKFRDGVTIDEVYQAWRSQLMTYRDSATTPLAKHAIASWSDRKNTPFWQVHTMNLVAALPSEPLRANTTIDFEPIASVDGQAFYLEDMFLIMKSGAEILTPGIPYSAEEIEAAMLIF